MTTATKPRRRAKAKFSAKLGSAKANFGDKTASLPMFIKGGLEEDDGDLSLNKAYEYLCGRKIDVRVEVLGSDMPGQGKIWTEDDYLEAVATVKKFAVGPKGFQATMQFDLDLLGGEGVELLKSLNKRQGQVSILKVEELAGDDEEGDDETEEDETEAEK